MPALLTTGWSPLVAGLATGGKGARSNAATFSASSLAAFEGGSGAAGAGATCEAVGAPPLCVGAPSAPPVSASASAIVTRWSKAAAASADGWPWQKVLRDDQ